MRDGRVECDGLLVVVPGNFWSSMGVGGFALFARGDPPVGVITCLDLRSTLQQMAVYVKDCSIELRAKCKKNSKYCGTPLYI